LSWTSIWGERVFEPIAEADEAIIDTGDPGAEDDDEANEDECDDEEEVHGGKKR